MAGERLLDTSIIVGLLRSRPGISERFSVESEFLVSVIALGELYVGAKKSTDQGEEVRKVEEFLFNCKVLNCDLNTARVYAEVKHGLLVKGKPIPENDVWLAAQAIEHDLILVSRDEHFNWVDGLTLERW